MAAIWRRIALFQRVLLPLAVAVVFILIWEYGTKLAKVSPLLFAPPSAVWKSLELSFPILVQQSLPTLKETLLGFALASLLGVTLGTALVLSKRVRQALYPHILLFQLIPKVALAPLFIVWLGIGPTSRLSFAVFMAFFPVVIATMTGLLSADRNIVRLCTSLTATPWQTFMSVRVPYAMPHLFAGLKIAVTMAIIGVIVGEFVTAQEGLGYIIMFASSADDTALVFAAIGMLCAVGLTLYGAVALVEMLIQRRLGVTITSSEF
ncbi:ABC transporter permease [Aquabacter sp. CN5-332]|uniref:ABC transporter permease n=1 Tax=Aquabacter sp. CN5-332 TaxID=3156608 RepID=UPI0032B32F96